MINIPRGKVLIYLLEMKPCKEMRKENCFTVGALSTQMCNNNLVIVCSYSAFDDYRFEIRQK